MILTTCFYNIYKASIFISVDLGLCGCFLTRQAGNVLISLMPKNQACFSEAECYQSFRGSTDYLHMEEADLFTK